MTRAAACNCLGGSYGITHERGAAGCYARETGAAKRERAVISAAVRIRQQAARDRTECDRCRVGILFHACPKESAAAAVLAERSIDND